MKVVYYLFSSWANLPKNSGSLYHISNVCILQKQNQSKPNNNVFCLLMFLFRTQISVFIVALVPEWNYIEGHFMWNLIHLGEWLDCNVRCMDDSMLFSDIVYEPFLIHFRQEFYFCAHSIILYINLQSKVNLSSDHFSTNCNFMITSNRHAEWFSLYCLMARCELCKLKKKSSIDIEIRNCIMVS